MKWERSSFQRRARKEKRRNIFLKKKARPKKKKSAPNKMVKLYFDLCVININANESDH